MRFCKIIFLLLFLSPYVLAEESILECRYKGYLNQYEVVEEINYISESRFILVIDPEEKRLDYIEPSGISLNDLREDNIDYESEGDEILFQRSFQPEGNEDLTVLEKFRLNRITGKLQQEVSGIYKDETTGIKDTYFHSCIKRESFF